MLKRLKKIEDQIAYHEKSLEYLNEERREIVNHLDLNKNISVDKTTKVLAKSNPPR